MVLFQGGTITIMFKNIIQHKASCGMDLGLSIFKNPFFFDRNAGEIIPFYGSKFILNFGLTYFLIIPAIILLIRRHFKKSIFLIIVSCFAFLVPFVISFNWFWQETLNYFFRFSSLIWTILVSIFLVLMLSQFKDRRFLRGIIYFCLIVVCLKGTLFLLTRPLYKKIEYRFDNSEFFITLRPSSEIESLAYEWIEKNSTIQYYFLVFADKNDIDNQVSVVENFRFVMLTQRLAPIYTQSNNYFSEALPSDKYYTPSYKRLISDCNNSDMKILNYKYLFVDKNWPIGLEEKCLKNNKLELRFNAKEEDKFIRIYEVK